MEIQQKRIFFGISSHINYYLTQILFQQGVEVAPSEPYHRKRELASGWGAKVSEPRDYSRVTHGRRSVVDATREEFGEVHAVFEMVGTDETLLDAIALAESGFRALVFGAQKMQYVPYADCRRKGVELVYPEAMVNSKAGKNYWTEALDVIAGKEGNRLDLECLIAKRISLEEAVDAFHHYDCEKWIKVIVEPHRKLGGAVVEAVGSTRWA